MNGNYYQQNNYQQQPVQQYYAPAPKKSNAKFLLPVAIFVAEVVSSIVSTITIGVYDLFSDFSVAYTINSLVVTLSAAIIIAIYLVFACVSYKDLKGRMLFLGAAFLATRIDSLISNILSIVEGFFWDTDSIFTVIDVAFNWISLACAMVAAYFIVDFIEKKILKEETAEYYAPAQPVYQQPQPQVVQTPVYGEENAQQYNNY